MAGNKYYHLMNLTSVDSQLMIPTDDKLNADWLNK